MKAVGAGEYWEEFYSDRESVWSGKPNSLLVEEVSGLPAGTALDVGCGEGGDAIWLASEDWHVTAVDVSATALERAAEHAATAGVSEAIEWERHDVAASFPSGSFDLVSSCYLHSPVEIPRTRILRSAAAAVAPGGTLLVVGHAGSPSWAEPHPDVDFPTPHEVLDGLALPPGEWEVKRADAVTRELPDPEGKPATRPDNVLTVVRLPGGERLSDARGAARRARAASYRIALDHARVAAESGSPPTAARKAATAVPPMSQGGSTR